MILKNDKERIAFLEDYRNEGNGWYLWKEDKDLGRKMWRLDVEGGNASVIAEERLQVITWPRPEAKWLIRDWYLVTDWDDEQPFESASASRTIVLGYIKRLKEFAR